MMLFSFLQVFDYSKDFFYKEDKPKVLFEVNVSTFDKWERPYFKNTTDTITIPPKTSLGKSPKFSIVIEPHDVTARFVYITSPSVGPPVKNAWSYTDITTPEGKVFRYAAMSKHGESRLTALTLPIYNESVLIRSYFYNDNKEEEAVFKIPTIQFVEPIYVKIDSTTKEVSGHKNMCIKSCNITSDMGIIGLNALPIKNAFDLPRTIKDPNMYFSTAGEPYSRVVLLANATYVLAFNILQEEFMHMWHVTKQLDYTSFEMNMRARNSTGAEISYILWRVDTTSWTDAVEHWHEEFPEIYHRQTGGWGLWAAFPKLNVVFPDNNDELDVFHVAFQWGASPWKNKGTVPNWCYVESTLAHIDLPFNEKTYLDDIKKCKYDPVLNKTEKQQESLTKRCKMILESALRFPNGSLIIKQEIAPWNKNGTQSPVFFDGLAKEYYINKLNESYYLPIIHNYSSRYIGVAMDSFGSTGVTYIDEKSGYAPGKEYMPYFAADSKKRLFLPIFSGMFNAVNIFKQYSPRGVLINGNYMMPELVKYTANIGCEIKIGNEDVGRITNPKYHINNFWTTRYTSGSRSISFIDNSHREISFKYKEEYFSIMASFGSASCYFSEDASTDNLWHNKDDIDYLRPFMKRWMPALSEAFQGNIFYANQLGLIKMDMPEDKQVPVLNENNDISSTTLWCKPKEKAVDGWVDCYTVAFLGYAAPHVNGSKFHREAHVTIYGTDIECLFVSNDMKCIVNDDGSVDVSIHGLPTNTAYRSSIIKFKRKLLSGYPDFYSGKNSESLAFSISVATALLIFGTIVFALWMHLHLKKKAEFADNPQKEEKKSSLNENLNLDD